MKRYWILNMITLAALAILALSTVVMLLWNWLVPALFNGPSISFGQALGLLILSKVLFSSLKQGRWGGDYLTRKRAWKNRFEEKWRNMTPEEREKFKSTMKQHCSKWGWMPQPSDSQSHQESV
ncbi:MAG: hypothetical protein WBA23_02895 [Tunicatimonas sp.]|uniref:hypothetical protein n=1 Tax=Tunicatimonas sp. TaxID=1940096 RepID=UPI003C7352EC